MKRLTSFWVLSAWLLVDSALRQFLEVAVHQRIRQGSWATVLDAIQFADKTLHPLGGSIPEPIRLPMKSAISVLSVNKLLCPRWFNGSVYSKTRRSLQQ